MVKLHSSLKLVALVATLGAVVPTKPQALPASQNVVIIGGSTLSPGCGVQSAANVMGATFGGCLALSGLTQTFTAMMPADVSAAALAPFDTVVLNMASVGMACSSSRLTAQARADLVAFVAAGNKLIIYDSECTPGPDYGWLPYPFTTNNPGAMGAPGTLNIVEDSSLGSRDLASPYFVDAPFLSAFTDAVGDMNVMTTMDSNWCVAMSGTNFNHVTGAVHTYAIYPQAVDHGLMIYNGLDQDYSTYAPQLRKIFELELAQAFSPSNLPRAFTVTGINLGPETAQRSIGESHTVVATLSDLLGNARPGITVTFTVGGANAEATGTCSPGSCVADANGNVSFTYAGAAAGTDQITASFVDTTGTHSKTVEVTWIEGTRHLTVAVTGSGNGAVSGGPIACGIASSGACAADLADGASLTLTATPDSDSVFEGWTGACAGSAPACTVTMTQDLSVGATFTARVKIAGPYTIPEGGWVNLKATSTLAGNLVFAWDLDGDGAFDDYSGAGAPFRAINVDGPAAVPVAVRVRNDAGAVFVARSVVNVTNVAPTATFAASRTTMDEGGAFTLSLGELADEARADLAVLRFAFDCGGGSGLGAPGTARTVTCAAPDDGTLTVRGAVMDDDGGVTVYQRQVVVHDVAPAVRIASPVGNALFAAGAPVSLGATFTDRGVLDTHACAVSWGDGSASAGAVTEAAGAGSCAASHAFARAGWYAIKVTVTDEHGAAAVATVGVRVQ